MKKIEITKEPVYMLCSNTGHQIEIGIFRFNSEVCQQAMLREVQYSGKSSINNDKSVVSAALS